MSLTVSYPSGMTHEPGRKGKTTNRCLSCDKAWPCPTVRRYRLMHLVADVSFPHPCSPSQAEAAPVTCTCGLTTTVGQWSRHRTTSGERCGCSKCVGCAEFRTVGRATCWRCRFGEHVNQRKERVA